MLFDGGFSFPNFLADVFAVFVFVVWFWLLITVFGDLFRRHDISGWGKALWVIVMILFPYIGVFIYMITQGRGMTERNAPWAERARDELRAAGAMAPGASRHEALDRLTPREREIVALVAKGLSNSDIAGRLLLSPLTVKTHVNRAMSKLGVRDRAQLVVIAYESGLVRPRVE